MTAALDVLTRDNLHLSKVTNGEKLTPGATRRAGSANA
jgi:hypothetical protein